MYRILTCHRMEATVSPLVAPAVESLPLGSAASGLIPFACARQGTNAQRRAKARPEANAAGQALVLGLHEKRQP